MTFRLMGCVTAVALLAAGAAQAQTSGNNAPTGGGGQMAYPEPLQSGEIRVPAQTGRDTGNMAYPSGPSVPSTSPSAPDTGSMAYPGGTALQGTGVPKPGMPKAAMPAAAAPAPGVRPTAAGMSAAKQLEVAPAAQPVPYVDFGAGSAAPAGSGHMMHHGAHHGAMHKTPAK